MTQLATANQQLARQRQRHIDDGLEAIAAYGHQLRQRLALLPGQPPQRDDAYSQPDIPTLGQLQTSHPKMQTAVRVAQQWLAAHAAGQHPSLILHATDGSDWRQTGYGCGKTHIARALLFDKLFAITHEDGRVVASRGTFLTDQQLIESLGEGSRINRILNSRKRWHDGLRQMVLMHPPVVVIDDAGTAEIDYDNDQRKRHSRYYRLINHCYDSGIAVIVTANAATQELRTIFGGRAYSRLLEMAPRPYILDMSGIPDHRITAGGR